MAAWSAPMVGTKAIGAAAAQGGDLAPSVRASRMICTADGLR
jgi:hypothetical protein